MTKVTRFHHLLSPESLFYPTASQVKQLALARTKKVRINVIIGGSSVLNGAGQQAHELWSDKLAKLLGPEYRVVNLGFRGAETGEFGALAAQMIMDQRRVIFFGDIRPGQCNPDPDGSRYRYFFWDAWYKGLIDRNIPLRNERLAALPRLRASDQQFTEVRCGARMDSAFYFNDLWNARTYNTGGTVWNSFCLAESFKPRMWIRDGEPPPPPLNERYSRMKDRGDIDQLVARTLRPVVRKDSRGQWVADSEKQEDFRQAIRYSLAHAALRQRTILLVNGRPPMLLARLTPDQREHFSALLRLTREVVEAEGMRSLELGGILTDSDYADDIHLSGSGGEKLAAMAAPAIRELAASLGYHDSLQHRKE